MFEFMFNFSEQNYDRPFDLSNTGLTDDSLDELVKTLNARPDIKALKLESCANPSLMQISTTPNLITAAGVEKLTRLRHVEAIELSGNVIGSRGAELLAGMPSLKYCSIHNCKIGPLGFYAFLRSESLIDLYIAYNAWTNETMLQLTENDLTQLLTMASINIDTQLLGNALGGNAESAKAILEFLNQNHRTGLVIENIAHFWRTQNDITTSVKSNLAKTTLAIWENLIDDKLNQNRSRNNPVLAQKYSEEKQARQLEKEVMQAIEKSDISTLSQLIPKLPKGVNHYLEFGCHLVTHSIMQNKPFVTRFLLDHGAHVEVHEREKTSLMNASEQGKVEFVKLFLLRGANITGEYYFNAEIAFSIAAFKVTECCVYTIRAFQTQNLKSKLPLPLQSELGSYPREWDNLFSQEPHQLNLPNLPSSVQIFEGEPPLWVIFGNNEQLRYGFAKRGLTLLHNISKVSEFQPNEWYNKAQNYRVIYRLLHDKIAIIQKKTPLSLDEYFSILQGQASYLIAPFPTQAPQHQMQRQELDTIINTLNTELQTKTETTINWNDCPPLFIAQYRCVHYYTHFFDANQRRDHTQTSHLGRLAPAVAVYQMSSLTPLQSQLARESKLVKNAIELRGKFEQFYRSGPVVIHSKTYQSMGHYLQERMSNEYAQYQSDIKARKNWAYEILDDLAAHGYPHYASSDLIDHALRYGYGLKKVGSLAHGILKPGYDQTGKPTHAILGKIFISLFTPLEMAALRTRHPAGMHNRAQITLRDTVIPERETDVAGGVDAGYVFYESCLSVPDFSGNWDDSCFIYFGLNREQFNSFKSRFHQTTNSSSRDTLATEIINVVKDHQEKQLLRIAQQEAQLRGGHLIYRCFEKQYALEPEKLRHSGRAPYVSQHERALLGSVGNERFSSAAQNAYGFWSQPASSADDNNNETASDFSNRMQ